ncbi:MAG TPA: hypothetical protein VIE91_00540 [Methylophilaceae bacterium]|jgi:hypothetical protein
METLPVHLFRTSFGPFITLLNKHEIKYRMRANRTGIPIANGEVLEVIKILSSATFWPSLAAVIVAFIKSRSGRKVIISTNDNTAIQAEGLSIEKIEELLHIAKNISAIDTNQTEKSEP